MLVVIHIQLDIILRDRKQILPYFVIEVSSNKKGLPSIFLTCAFSGSLSTISSGLNNLMATIVEDDYKRLLHRQLTGERQGFICNTFSLIPGIIVMALTYVVSNLSLLVHAAVSLAGILSGAIMDVFMRGFFFRTANAHGSFIGFLRGIGMVVWIFIRAQVTKNQRSNQRLPLSTSDCSNMKMAMVLIF